MRWLCLTGPRNPEKPYFHSRLARPRSRRIDADRFGVACEPWS